METCLKDNSLKENGMAEEKQFSLTPQPKKEYGCRTKKSDDQSII